LIAASGAGRFVGAVPHALQYPVPEPVLFARRRTLKNETAWTSVRKTPRTRREQAGGPRTPRTSRPIFRTVSRLFRPRPPARVPFIRHTAHLGPFAHFPRSFAPVVVAFLPVHRPLGPATRLVRQGRAVRIPTVHVPSLHRCVRESENPKRKRTR